MPLHNGVYICKADGMLYLLRGDYATRQDGQRMKIEDEESFRRAMVKVQSPIETYEFLKKELKGRDSGERNKSREPLFNRDF